MKVFSVLFVGVVALSLPSEGSTDDDGDIPEHFISYGPHGEIADEDTPYIYVEDDDGNPQIGFIGPSATPNVSFAPTPMELSRTVRFHLYTRSTANSAKGELLLLGEDHTLIGSRFNPNLPVKVLIHGFGNTIESATIQGPMKAYLETGDYNVIGVDWGDQCVFPWYESARANTIPVGHYVADMLRYLMQAAGVHPKNIHLIGHSLGAHVSGIAGHGMAHYRLARVTGLDPARPSYGDTPDTDMLDQTDAEFVDVIHTCAGYNVPWLGMMIQRGNADFYPNGGQHPQPGCEGWYLPETIPCSHSKAHKLWTESIRNPGKYPAYRCDSVTDAGNAQCFAPADGVMGDGASSSMRGIFGLKTD